MKRSGQHSKEGAAALALNVSRLSLLLTRKRGDLPAAYLKDPGLREAYIEYFLPSNIHKLRVPLQELSLHSSGLLVKEKLRILDVGSGPGTAVLGVMEFFSDKAQKPELEFTALDQVAENLHAAEGLFEKHRDELNVRASLRTIRSGIEGLERLSGERFDMVILSNVLNELYLNHADKIAKRTTALLGLLGRLLNDDGSCIIIEPALRETSREMLEVRDGILSNGFHVYSPCLIDGKCPALANPKDWCHEDIAWEPPDFIKEIDKLTGLRKDSLKFSYLVLRKDSFSLADASGSDVFRVVSDALVSKGKVEFYACGPGGRRLITRLDKNRTSRNQAFEMLARGAVVSFEQLVDEGKRYRVGKETGVHIVQDIPHQAASG
jgi:SAM-dependent methyltransferase